MDSTLNPYHLLALMQNTIGVADHHAIRKTPIDASKVIRGASDRFERNKRTFPVLDALASLCVSKQRGQVVALALQLSQHDKKLRLTIAENDKVDVSVVPYLRRLWCQIQTLSKVFQQERQIHHRTSEDPKISPEYVQDLRTLSQLQSAHADYWPRSYRFMVCASHLISEMLKEGDESCEKLEKEIDQDPRQKRQFNLRRTLQKLISQQMRFETLLAFANSPRLHAIVLYDLELQEVPAPKRFSVHIPSSAAVWKNVIHNICCPYLRSGSDWLDQESDEQGKEIPNKEWEVGVHCECALISYLIYEKQQAKRNDLNLGPTVTTCRPTTVNMADIPGRSYELLTALKPRAEVTTTSSHVRPMGTGIQWAKIPPFSYIGVSKLSCGACKAWLRAYNKLGYSQFYTRGSHGNWHWPWGLPELARDLLCREIVGEISRVFIEHHRAHRNLLGSSESSHGHAPSLRFTVRDEDMDNLNAYSRAQVHHTYQLSLGIIPPSSIQQTI